MQIVFGVAVLVAVSVVTLALVRGRAVDNRKKRVRTVRNRRRWAAGDATAGGAWVYGDTGGSSHGGGHHGGSGCGGGSSCGGGGSSCGGGGGGCGGGGS